MRCCGLRTIYRTCASVDGTFADISLVYVSKYRMRGRGDIFHFSVAILEQSAIELVLKAECDCDCDSECMISFADLGQDEMYKDGKRRFVYCLNADPR